MAGASFWVVAKGSSLWILSDRTVSRFFCPKGTERRGNSGFLVDSKRYKKKLSHSQTIHSTQEP